MTSGVQKLRILKIAQVADRCCVSRSWIEEHIRAGDFPRPILIGKTARGWLEHEIEAWIAEKVRQREETLAPKIALRKRPAKKRKPADQELARSSQ